MIQNKLVTIIIRTKNEERWISKCLKKIYKQTYKNFEIIIIDNNSDDKTIKKANEFKLKKIININKFLPGKAINLGLKESKGDFIVCISAHCIPKNNYWLKNLVEAISENENYAAVYGKQEPMNFTNDSDTRDLFLTFGLDKKIQVKDSFFHNANSIIRKNILKKNKFDEKTKNIEDRLWAKKILDLGYRIVYEPKACVYHYHGIHQSNNENRASSIVQIIKDKKILNVGKIDPKDLNIVAIIPIKGKSIKISKNYLLDITIQHLQKSKFIKSIFISSDNKYNFKISKKYKNVKNILRPKKYSKNNISVEDVQKFSLEIIEEKFFNPDLIVHCEETFPFRDPVIIDKVIIKTISEGLDTCVAAKREIGSIWHEQNNGSFLKIDSGNVPRIIKEKNYIAYNGLCTVTYPEILRNGSFNGNKIGIFEIDNTLSTLELRNLNQKKIFKKIIS